MSTVRAIMFENCITSRIVEARN